MLPTMKRKRTKIAVIGGGTGTFTVLQGLKNDDFDLSAIVSMADDGGSTGILRDELGVLPPGDVRQCLVALSNSSRLMRELMNYRFHNGSLGGHSFGNLFLSALEKVTGSFEKAVAEAGRILAIKGKVIPVTTHHVRLKMVLEEGTVLDGEGEIYVSRAIDRGFKRIYLEPRPRVNDRAVEAIRNADLIVFGPGGLYTSLIPNLLVQGLAEALRETAARKILVFNLMNKKGQTTGFTASDYLKQIGHFLGGDIFDLVLVNGTEPPPELVKAYADEAEVVRNDLKEGGKIRVADLLSGRQTDYDPNDVLAPQRALIRHDPVKLAREVVRALG